MIAVGKMAPGFTGTAVSSNRSFSLQAWRGQPVLLLFAGYRTAAETQEVARTIRRKYPQHTAVLLAIIIDLQSVPRLMRGVAQAAMATAVGDATRQIPDGYDPADQLIILPDWTGDICKAYAVADAGRQMALVLVDATGQVHATYQGTQIKEQALHLVTSLIEQ